MEKLQANIAIKKIKEVEFFVNEDVNIEDPLRINIGFELTTNFSLSEKTVELVLSTQFSNRPISNRPSGVVFMKIKVSNVFVVMELEQFLNSELKTFSIPDNVMVTFLSLSISHSRALLSKSALGTKFAELYIPIVNPIEIAKQLFGK